VNSKENLCEIWMIKRHEKRNMKIQEQMK